MEWHSTTAWPLCPKGTEHRVTGRGTTLSERGFVRFCFPLTPLLLPLKHPSSPPQQLRTRPPPQTLSLPFRVQLQETTVVNNKLEEGKIFKIFPSLGLFPGSKMEGKQNAPL